MALVKPLFFNTTEGIEQEISPTTDSVALALLTLNGIGGIGINANGQSVTNLPAPSQASDAVTKQYVDSIAQGQAIKKACLAVATSNVTLSGSQTVDGVTLAAGNRALLIGQTDAKQNGIWLVQTGAWTRPADFATGSSVASAFVFVEKGTLNADNGYSCINDDGQDIVDTSPLTWTQSAAAGVVLAGSGLSKNGNTLNVALAPASGLQFTGNQLDQYLNPAGGLTKDASGLRALIVGAGTAQATLNASANGLTVLGVPSLFTVNGAATSANVTATNLSTLTAGNLSLADSLHSHQSVLGALAVVGYHACGSVLAAGDPVAWSSTSDTLVRGDATIDASARIAGIASQGGAAGTPVPIVKRGIAKAVLPNGIPGAPVFLNSGGGITQTAPSGQSLRLVRIGYLVNTAGDLDVNLYDLGKRSA